MSPKALTGVALLAAAVPLGAAAHHSFAVYFDAGEDITITGKVISFRFTNPHGTVVLEVADARGRVSEWRAETNAPSVLTRRGWTRTSIRPGETLTIDGWPSRDGRPYIRLRRAVRADGSLVGTAPFEQRDQS